MVPPFSKPSRQGSSAGSGTSHRQAFSAQKYAPPGQLALRPAAPAVSLWLNAGVPPTYATAWAGHSVNVLLRVYAKHIVGQDEAARRRVQAALTVDENGRQGESLKPVSLSAAPTGPLRVTDHGRASSRPGDMWLLPPARELLGSTCLRLPGSGSVSADDHNDNMTGLPAS